MIVYIMYGPLCKDLYEVLILFQSFGWSKKILMRKIMIATIIPFIQHSFADWVSFLLLATIKILDLQALNTIIHFYLRLQTFLRIHTITSSRNYVYKLPGKTENSTFLTQICLRNGFRFVISKNSSHDKSRYPRDLG